MALTEKDLQSVERIVDNSMRVLKELFLEKLNGHSENSVRQAKQIEHLYQLDRERVVDIATIKADIVRIDSKVDANAKVSSVEEAARDKREDAVDKVETKAVQKGQFSITTWVAIACAVIGPVIVFLIIGGK